MYLRASFFFISYRNVVKMKDAVVSRSVCAGTDFPLRDDDMTQSQKVCFLFVAK
jgi:hypothetical protein